MLDHRRFFRRAAVQLLACAALAVAACWVWRYVHSFVGESISESRGITLIRWRPDSNPELIDGGSVSYIPIFRSQGATPLAVIDITYTRTPSSNPLLAWLGLASDTSTTHTWFDDSISTHERLAFESTSRVRLGSQWGFSNIRPSLLAKDGRAFSVRIVFFKRVVAPCLALIACATGALGLRNLIRGRSVLRRVRAGQCRTCRYPLTGSGVCPECGNRTAT